MYLFWADLAYNILKVARWHCRMCHKSVNKPKKFKLVHQIIFPRDLGTSLGDYNWSGCALIKIFSGPSPRSDMHTPSCWAMARSYVCAKKTAIIRLKKKTTTWPTCRRQSGSQGESSWFPWTSAPRPSSCSQCPPPSSREHPTAPGQRPLQTTA